jgi:uncharacterized delta-60 repeat protein
MKKHGGSRRLAVGLFLVLALTAAAMTPTAGATVPLRGHLDRSFGSSGWAFTDFGSSFVSSRFSEMVRQDDGKLVLMGSLGRRGVLERRQPDGALDEGFGEGGFVKFGLLREMRGLAVDGAGGVLFGDPQVNGSCYGSRVRRLLPSGEPDKSFGADGASATIPLSVHHLALDAAGRILVAGGAPLGPCGKNIPPFGIGVARLQSDGSLDRSFGKEGAFVFDRGNEYFGVTSGLAVRADGSIRVSGGEFLLGLTPEGALDPGFGTDGEVEVKGGASALLALPGGDTMVAALSYSAPEEPRNRRPSDVTVSRYRADGSLDPGFGIAGTSTLDFDEVDQPSALALAPDGDAVLSVVAGPSACDRYRCADRTVLARFDPSGALDPSFGVGGWIGVDLPGEQPRYEFAPHLSPLAVTPAGRILAAGDMGNSSDAFVLAFDPAGRADPGFGGAGIAQEVHTRPSRSWPLGLAIDSDGEILVPAGTDLGSHSGQPTMLGAGPNGDFHPGAGYPFSDQSRDHWIGRGDYVYALGWAGVERYDSTKRSDDYGSGGVASLPDGFRGLSLAVRRDGEVVVVGSLDHRRGMAAVAFTPEGQRDRAFGHDGLAIIGFGGARGVSARSVAIDRAGRVVLFGHLGSRSVAARLRANGHLDPSFGRRGRLWNMPFSGYSEEGAVALQGSKILLTSRPYRQRGTPPFLLLRLNSDGTPDRSFGRGGKIQTGVGGQLLSLFAAGPQIVFVSTRWPLGGGRVLLRAYRSSDGAVDQRFGRHGVASAVSGPPRSFNPFAAARQEDGRIVIAASRSRVGGGSDIALLRFR